MQLQLETKSREAFELVTDALELVDEYQDSRDVEKLKHATEKLASARERDPNYFRAQYYDAIVDDLAGRSKEAVKKLSVLAAQPSPLINEVRYNLGLAEYHEYNHEALERAIEQFSIVLKNVSSPALRLRSKAGLAQAYAMHMIPKKPDEADITAIERYKTLALDCASAVLRDLRKQRYRWLYLRKPDLDSKVASEIGWTAHNAKGMALMYFADYLPRRPDESATEMSGRRLATLQSSLTELSEAEHCKAGDWANRCDMGSVNMRIGYFNNDKRYFHTALDLLRSVVDRLRPDYGFAIYEMGRTYRLMGQFDQAALNFEAALQIPISQRDVSDRRLNIELERARKKDATFP
jgi:tetratricopeptide (TPR) repeat protein